MQVQPFKNYLEEAKGDKKFLRLLIITDEPDNAKEFHTADRLQEECKKLNYPYYLFKLTGGYTTCLLYTSPSPRDLSTSRMPSSA